jgi:hypothetical protein
MVICFPCLGDIHGQSQGGNVGLKQELCLGLFYYQIQANGHCETKRMVWVKVDDAGRRLIMRIPLLTITTLILFLAGVGLAQDYPWCSTMDDIFAVVEDGDLVLHHDLATYNCCPDSFTFSVTVSNDSLFVTEKEVLTTPCDCLCCYKLATTVEGLSAGEWHVVYRWFDDEPWGWRDWYLTVIIGDTGPPGSVQFVHSQYSDCLDPSGSPEEAGFHTPEVRLLPNKPNPFNPHTTIAFELPRQMTVSLHVFDVRGRLIRELIDGEIFSEGRHEVIWNGRDESGRKVASGTYFFRLEAGNDSETKRMVLAK